MNEESEPAGEFRSVLLMALAKVTIERLLLALVALGRPPLSNKQARKIAARVRPALEELVDTAIATNIDTKLEDLADAADKITAAIATDVLCLPKPLVN
ncbi:MAG: hypothetical protein QM723_40600 [Myxococcaceae bacterium]